MAAGDFTIGDTSTSAPTELTTLFGVAQGIGDTPVLLSGPTQQVVPGGFGPGTGNGPPGTRGPSTTATVPGKSSTVTQVLQGFYGMDAASLQNLQQQLYAGGFFSSSYYSKTSPKVPQFGATDDDSFAAFKSAVVQAARSGKPLPTILSSAIASTAAGGGPGAPTKVVPPTVQPPNPADIRAVVTASAKTLLGHGVSEDVIGRIISGFTTEVTRSQAGVQNDQLTGGSVMQAPDVSSYVDQALRKANPTDVGMHSALQGADLALQAFQSSLGNAPTGGS